ncbi:bifunctional acetate--CoA ligase family protein/GNAT family N-acetyltransferase [Propylenella binzhouense]|uniref:Bifunctional acyl-CoA synthetase/GNAT family N-acetyltransferase n=1 Tax=Propylenella binzhouense TaxID=2555902 RepID=A0A964T2G1_9HYPH|nr:bifunctional acetate--CoA ligase family protein/GNAT family N-acetyltransferase [Propylenella binzhouense]MYZ46712.1 bifunctional acyl-CoA synthetase/GNAT family N-acetyltransferase [Propylenella binzhouense]
MTTRRLDRVFNPRSVALFGASDRPGTVGNTVARNLLQAGFSGELFFVNPRRPVVEGVQSVADGRELPAGVDLAVVAAPPAAIPEILETAGSKGTEAAVVLTAFPADEAGRSLHAAMMAAVHRHGIRLVGPNCIGILSPHVGLNASFVHRNPLPGRLALVSQSGAILTAILDWATSHEIGFSHLVSVGNMADVDADDLIDYFAADPNCRAILLYLEGIVDAGPFVSAGRAAARIKPVVAIKSARAKAGAQAAHTHTGAMAGSDAVYDAVFERAGILRVTDLGELFDMAETLTHLRPFDGERLAILTNGGGAGILAVDSMEAAGGVLATLSPETQAHLDAALPPTWSHANPVDIIGDSDPGRYRVALEGILGDEGVDAVLVLYCPTSVTKGIDAARAVIEVVEAHRRRSARPKPVLTVWLGSGWVQDARDAFAAAAIPTFDTPRAAVESYRQIVAYARLKRGLLSIPPREATAFPRNRNLVAQIVAKSAASETGFMKWPEAREVLAAYDIPVVRAGLARTPDEAAAVAAGILEGGRMCAMKIVSPQVVHKSDVGGVRLNIASVEEARQAAAAMGEAVRRAVPGAVIDGFMIEEMVERRHGTELIVGLADDPTFGPILLFGAGGTAVEVIADKAIALPPLDRQLALQLMSRTRIIRLLRGYRDVPAANIEEIAATLVKISQLAIDFPEIRELDINPLVADETGVVAIDARMTVRPVSGGARAGIARFAIRPYPEELSESMRLLDGTDVFVRPVRPADAWLYQDFFDRLEPEDIRLRLLSVRRQFTEEFFARFTQVDYAREIAFVAFTPDEQHILGVSRLVLDADAERAEYAVVVRSDLKGKGLGWLLMRKLIDYAKSEEIPELYGHVLKENSNMLQMARELGFRTETDPDDPALVMVRLDLRSCGAGGQSSSV